MQPNEFQEHLKDILCSENGYGFSVFCCVKKDGKFTLKKLNVKDDFREEIENTIVCAINCNYLDENAMFDTADNIADNTTVFYIVESNEHYKPYEFLSTSENVKDVFSEDDRSDLLGFAFRFSIDKKLVWAYQHVYPISISKKSKGLFAYFSGGNIFEKLTNSIFSIENRVDVIIIENTICPTKINFLEKYFGFENYIRNEAQNTVKEINNLELIDDIGSFNNFINKETLTNAKKLLKIKNPPVLSIPKEIIIQKLSTISRYSDIKIKEGKIIVTSQKDVSIVLKMLNDDFLRSELSEREYDSPSKKVLPDE